MLEHRLKNSKLTFNQINQLQINQLQINDLTTNTNGKYIRYQKRIMYKVQ